MQKKKKKKKKKKYRNVPFVFLQESLCHKFESKFRKIDT